MKRCIIILACTLFCALTSSSYAFGTDDSCTAHPDNIIMHNEHCEVLALVPEDAATDVALASGNWSDPDTWSAGIPIAGANVLISSGVVVTYDMFSDVPLHWIRVNGTLTFATHLNTKLKVNTIVVDPLGVFTIGTEADPVDPDVTAKILFSDDGPIDTDWDPYLFSKGLISHGALTCYGAYKRAYASIANPPAAGATFLRVSDTPDGWRVGDQLVLTGTHSIWPGDDALNMRFEDEVLTITEIAGKNIYFTNNATGETSLLYDHIPPSGFGLHVYVANITRNIDFETENYSTVPISQRGHFMMMHNTNQKVYYTEFYGLGRTDKTQLVTDPVVDADGTLVSGGENPRGRYACHVHRAGTNNTTVEPVHIAGCVVFDTPGWGFVNHASNVIMENNVVFDFQGAAFVTEDGNELGSFIGNFAIKGLGTTLITDSHIRTLAFDGGYEGNGYWIQGPNVDYQDNIAASCAGYAFRVLTDDDDYTAEHHPLIPVSATLFPEIAGGADSIYSGALPLRPITGCIAYNCRGGLAFWTHLYNNDNVGDYSESYISEFTHNEYSLFENFQFWNNIFSGIDIKYSGQVHLKNGLLLGDLDNQYQTNPWETNNADKGIGIVGNKVTGEVNCENLTMEGWQKAMPAFRTDDLVSEDDNEYNFRTSQLIGGYFDRNLYNIYPEPGLDSGYLPDYNRFPAYFEITGNPVFHSIIPTIPPLADFSYSSAGGTSLRFNASISSDGDPGVSNAGNGIAAYGWDFGDGQTGSGVDPVHAYPSAGNYTVTLTVFDSQGETATRLRHVTVDAENYPNSVVNSGFEQGPVALVTSPLKSLDFLINKGWVYKDEWEILDGKATITKSISGYKPLAQVIQNDHAMQGPVSFSFQAKNLGDGASGNDLRVEVYGINGEFIDKDYSLPGTLEKWDNNDASFTADLLLDEDFGLASYDWQTFTRTLDLGGGYQFYVILFYSSGLKIAKADIQGVDNVCLPCTCGIPQHGEADELSATHAMLIWDNVGSAQYQVQFRQQGTPWNNYEVENTYLEFGDLLPGTTYQWRTRALCDGSFTGYSQTWKFTTPVTGSSCTSPVILSANLITESQATLNWNSIPGALQYEVAYRKSGTGSWTTLFTDDNSLTLGGLIPASLYQWQVRTQCAEGWKNYSTPSFFNTLILRSTESSSVAASSLITILPNPAKDHITVMLHTTFTGNVHFTIYDLLGQPVLYQSVDFQTGDSACAFDLHRVPPGVYFLSVQDDAGEIRAVERLVIQ